MPENDLKLICDAMPCSYVADLSTQAHNIYKAITGVDVEFVITSGTQPSLYAPIVTQNGLTWNASTNIDNGGYANSVTNTATLDGVPINIGDPLTRADHGKTLTVTSSAPMFNDALTSITVVIPDDTRGISSNGRPGFLSDNSNLSHHVFIIGDTSPSVNAGGNSYYSSVEYSLDGGLTWITAPSRYFSFVYPTTTPNLLIPDLNKVLVRVKYRSNSSSCVFPGPMHFKKISANADSFASGLTQDNWNVISQSSNTGINYTDVLNNASDVEYGIFRLYYADSLSWYNTVDYSYLRSDTLTDSYAGIRYNSVPQNEPVEFIIKIIGS